MKRTRISTAVAALAMTLCSCGGNEEPESVPPSTAPTSATPMTPAPSTPTFTPTPEPTWDDGFSPAQLGRYRAARDVWLEYWDFYKEIARKGVDTPAVLRGFERYSINPLGERSSFLDIYVRGGARMEVPPEVLWTSAKRITQKSVDFNYCLDFTDSVTTVNGKVDPVDPPFRTRVTVRIDDTSEGWKLRGYLNVGEAKACPPTAP